MPRHLQGPALLAACMAGRSVIVIVEGETDEKDAWFYQRWFDQRATEVTFLPQNGWEKVVVAVQDLRGQLPMRQVFGLIDRDHADDAVIAAQRGARPADGVFRTERFTLENHFLEPDLLFRYLRQVHRGQPPAPCGSAADLAAIVRQEYERCVPLSAFNLALRHHVRPLTTAGARRPRRAPHREGRSAVMRARWASVRGHRCPLS